MGCNRPGAIEVDLTSAPVRFIVDHRGWPRPFWWPRVTEFVIAGGEGESGELVWHLKSTSTSGELAHQLAFIYGRVPPSFYQVFPNGDQVPQPLERGQVYYIAAGGKKTIYRIAFSLPVEPEDIAARRRVPAR